MATYAHVTIEVAGAGIERFLSAMPEAVEFLERTVGWKLRGAFVQQTGRLYTVIDLWELEDMNHFQRGLRRLQSAAFFPAFKAMLDQSVLRETVVLAESAPYMH